VFPRVVPAPRIIACSFVSQMQTQTNAWSQESQCHTPNKRRCCTCSSSNRPFVNGGVWAACPKDNNPFPGNKSECALHRQQSLIVVSLISTLCSCSEVTSQKHWTQMSLRFIQLVHMHQEQTFGVCITKNDASCNILLTCCRNKCHAE